MEVQVHEAPFDQLLPEWQALFEADPLATPYVSPGWALPWWRQWGDGKRAQVVAVRDDRELVGLAPLAIRRTGPLRVLGPLGKEPADYWDVLSVPAAREDVLGAVFSELLRRARHWDLLELRALPQGSPTVGTVERMMPWLVERTPIPCPGLALPSSFDAYLASLPSRRRRNVRRAARQLEEGELEVREVADPEELPELVAHWHELRLRQWDHGSRAMDPAHRSERFRNFITDMTMELVPRELALVWEVRHAGERAGVFINLVDERSFYWYLGAYEPRLAKLGIGKAAVCESIRCSIAAGRSYFDFTVGDERYKYEFGASDRLTPSLLAGSNRPRSQAARAAVQGRARMKGIA